jgi:hypothetical protein
MSSSDIASRISALREKETARQDIASRISTFREKEAARQEAAGTTSTASQVVMLPGALETLRSGGVSTLPVGVTLPTTTKAAQTAQATQTQEKKTPFQRVSETLVTNRLRSWRSGPRRRPTATRAAARASRGGVRS